MFFNNTYWIDQHLSDWSPHWFFRFGGRFVHWKNMIDQCVGYHLLLILWFVEHCSSMTTEFGMVFAQVIFLEPMPVHQSKSCTCWFLSEMAPGAINLAVNNLLNYALIYPKSFLSPYCRFLKWVRSVQILVQIIWTNLDLCPEALGAHLRIWPYMRT